MDGHVSIAVCFEEALIVLLVKIYVIASIQFPFASSFRHVGDAH